MGNSIISKVVVILSLGMVLLGLPFLFLSIVFPSLSMFMLLPVSGFTLFAMWSLAKIIADIINDRM